MAFGHFSGPQIQCMWNSFWNKTFFGKDRTCWEKSILSRKWMLMIWTYMDGVWTSINNPYHLHCYFDHTCAKCTQNDKILHLLRWQNVTFITFVTSVRLFSNMSTFADLQSSVLWPLDILVVPNVCGIHFGTKLFLAKNWNIRQVRKKVHFE